jgi:hypothetical protein
LGAPDAGLKAFHLYLLGTGSWFRIRQPVGDVRGLVTMELHECRRWPASRR